MVYANFLLMKEEISLVAVIVILLIYDIFGTPKSLKYFQPIACILVGIHILLNIWPAPDTRTGLPTCAMRGLTTTGVAVTSPGG